MNDILFGNSNRPVIKKLSNRYFKAGKSRNSPAYQGSNFLENPALLISGIVGILLIMITGYLIIYNIFQISVIQDIQSYGQLKTLGTTKRQIKKLISKQAMLLSFIGIPFGLLSIHF